MNTAVLITLIVCGTILCIFGMAFIVNHKQKKDVKKATAKVLESIFNDESEE